MNYKEREECALHQIPELCLESPMEKSLWEEMRILGLTPVMQYKVAGYFLDFAFPDLQLGVEYDGAYHIESLERYEADERRRKDLLSKGWRVISINHFTELFDVSIDDRFVLSRMSLKEVAQEVYSFIRSQREVIREGLRNQKENEKRNEAIENLKKFEENRRNKKV